GNVAAAVARRCELGSSRVYNYTPIWPLAFHTATTDGRAVPVPPSGQCDSGLSMLLSSCSPGCCTHTVTRSSVTTGPHVSAPFGTVRNCLVSPRFGPSSATANNPSL